MSPSPVLIGKFTSQLMLCAVRFCESRIFLQQIQRDQQIFFSVHLLASLNLLEITNHDDAKYDCAASPPGVLKGRDNLSITRNMEGMFG